MEPSTNPYQAPASDVTQPAGGGRQDWKDLYLSFQGRVPRKVLWLYFVLPMFVGALIVTFVDGLLGTAPVLSLVFNLAIIWPSLAISVKRWHDRNKSGWWVLIGLVPVIGPIWALVETGFLRGTEGDNRFGGEPSGY